EDRFTYLGLLRQNLEDAKVRILAYCLMSNHVHLIAVPAREDSLSILIRRVHSRYAQYFNARVGRTGHLWHNRFYGCMLATRHLWTAIAYVERNPIRARMVRRAEIINGPVRSPTPEAATRADCWTWNGGNGRGG